MDLNGVETLMIPWTTDDIVSEWLTKTKNKVVFGMGGRSGQAVLIDMEDSRIIVVNSVHYNKDRYKYNVKKLLINPIKNGKKSFEK